jgi:membrane protease YdiL (CAAX protease family)
MQRSPEKHDRQLPAGQSLILLVSLLLPTLITWVYFVALDGQQAIWQQGAYTFGKAVQFLLPLWWALWILGERPAIGEGPWQSRFKAWLTRPQGSDWLLGIGFGLAVGGWMLLGYYGWLRPAGLFDRPAEAVASKVRSIGIGAPLTFAAVGIFYSLIHSGLEEYYWRWFVFDRAMRGYSLPLAIGLSSVGFAAHHVLVLAHYFGYGSPLTWLATISIVIGGAFWAWLYRRSGSLLPVWISHAVVDAAIFLVGWDLIRSAA